MILDFILKPTVPSGQPVLQDEVSQLGSKLFQQDNWSDDPVVNKRRQIGVLVAVPQVPPFMTEHFPEVAEVTDGNPLVLSDLCQEWFERIVWIPNDKLNQVVASSDQLALAQVAQMESIRQLLASPFSLGCSPASPAVRLYQALPGPGGLALEKSVEVFQCIVDSNVTGTKIIDSMTVVSTEAALQTTGLQRLVVSGGLTPDNVAAAVRTLRPFAVDVASGVESAPGIKDPARMAALVENAKAA